MGGVLFLIAVVAAILAVIFFLQARTNGLALLAQKDGLLAARKEAEEARAQAREAQAESKAKGVQLVDLRDKLTEAKRKNQEARSGKQPSRGVREAELLEDLAHARKLTEDAHAAEAQARREAAAAKADASAARSELRAAQDKLRELLARPHAAAVAGGPPSPAPAQAATPAQPAQDEARLREARQQAADAERRAAEADLMLRELRTREAALREELKKAKGRAETNNRVFLVARGELEVTRERLAQAERKLWQAGIALPASSPKERPKAKGPAAAERSGAAPGQADVRGQADPGAEKQAAGGGGEAAAAEEAAEQGAKAPEEGASVGEGESSEAAQGPQAVEPLRRRPHLANGAGSSDDADAKGERG
jgi:hypothetical protein